MGTHSQWNNAETSLRIDSHGSVAYERRGDGNHVTINAPIREFRGDDFVVGLPLVNTTFEVRRSPWFEAGHWRMVVDGALLAYPGQLADRDGEADTVAPGSS